MLYYTRLRLLPDEGDIFLSRQMIKVEVDLLMWMHIMGVACLVVRSWFASGRITRHLKIIK